MSGGYFDYKQYQIGMIINRLEEVINRNGKEIPAEEQWHDEEWLEKYPEDKYYREFSDKTMKRFKDGLSVLKAAKVFIQRIDWLLSGDDGEDDFHKRLKEDLNEI